MRRITILIIMFMSGLLLLCQSVDAGEFTFVYSNDMRGVIDPCPT